MFLAVTSLVAAAAAAVPVPSHQVVKPVAVARSQPVFDELRGLRELRASRSRLVVVPKATAIHVQPHRSSSPRPHSARITFVGSRLSSTAYCETGIMANGNRTFRGAAAGNRWPLGTHLRVSDSPYGPGVFVVEDRIGHGSRLDFAMPGNCSGAKKWGRRSITVSVVAS